MPTGFLPIDPSLPTCQRRDDMGRKVGMTWLLNRVLKERQPLRRQAVEPLPTSGDRGSRPAMTAKRENAYQSVKKPEKDSTLGTPTLRRVGRGGGAAERGSARKGWLNA